MPPQRAKGTCLTIFLGHLASTVLNWLNEKLLLEALMVDRSWDEQDNWASEASPTLGCSIEISRDICICCRYVCRMSNHVESRESNTRMLKVSIGR